MKISHWVDGSHSPGPSNNWADLHARGLDLGFPRND